MDIFWDGQVLLEGFLAYCIAPCLQLYCLNTDSCIKHHMLHLPELYALWSSFISLFLKYVTWFWSSNSFNFK